MLLFNLIQNYAFIMYYNAFLVAFIISIETKKTEKVGKELKIVKIVSFK